jgi:hypothetical protein
VLKAPTRKLNHDELLLNSVLLNFNLRPYTWSVVLGAGVALSLNKKGDDETADAE